MTKRGVTALKNGTWEEFQDTFKKKMKASEWAFVEEASEKVAQGEADQDEHRPRNQDKKYRLLEDASSRQREGKEALRCPTCARIATVSNVSTRPNLVNPLKLLASQQDDGDGLFQSTVKDSGKENRKGLTDGLREFFKDDNERAFGCWVATQGHEYISSTKAESARRVLGCDCQGEPG